MPIVTSPPTWAWTAPTISSTSCGQRAAVGVAQHDVAGALHDRRLQRPQRELGVGLVAVEEVLHVDEHPAALAGEELDGVGDHRLALVERRLQRLGDVVLRALGDDAHGRRAGLDEVAQRGVVVDLAPRPAGRPERDERARGQLQLRGRPGRRTRCPSGWPPASRPRCSARRGGRAARRCAACPPPSPRRPRPGGRRAAWCRRPRPGAHRHDLAPVRTSPENSKKPPGGRLLRARGWSTCTTK